jgi:UDP-N-acetyl-D-galactosamine dehydrogenase
MSAIIVIQVADVVDELLSYGIQVDTVDPYADPEEVKHEYGIDITNEINGSYDAIVLAVAHKPYTMLNEKFFSDHLNNRGVLFDVKGLYKHMANLSNFMRFKRYH